MGLWGAWGPWPSVNCLWDLCSLSAPFPASQSLGLRLDGNAPVPTSPSPGCWLHWADREQDALSEGLNNTNKSSEQGPLPTVTRAAILSHVSDKDSYLGNVFWVRYTSHTVAAVTAEFTETRVNFQPHTCQLLLCKPVSMWKTPGPCSRAAWHRQAARRVHSVLLHPYVLHGPACKCWIPNKHSRTWGQFCRCHCKAPHVSSQSGSTESVSSCTFSH